VETVYLDTATVVTIDLDHCTLRFIPTRNYASPDRELSVPKIRAFLSKDEKVTLQTEVCTSHVKLRVVNAREPSLKYRDYRCDFEVIVPEGVVLPGLLILEHRSSFVCCCVSRCVAVCCSVWRCDATEGVWCVAVCCGVLRCVAVCCGVLESKARW